MSLRKDGIMIVLSSPSGAGKTTLVKLLSKNKKDNFPIAGINIPQNKLVHIGLTYIYGIGDKFSKQICSSLEIPKEKRVNQLTDDEILKIRENIITIGRSLKEAISENNFKFFLLSWKLS